MSKTFTATKSKASKRKPSKPKSRRHTTLHKSSNVHKFVTNLRTRALYSEHKFKSGGSCRVSDQVALAPDAESVELASSLVSLNTVYRFRLAGVFTLSMTSGTINTYAACDPSAAGINFSEWSTLSALFSEFRLVEFGCQIVPNNNVSTGTSSCGALAVCGNLGTAIAPGSYAAVADNADSKLMNLYTTTPLGYTHVIDGRGIEWSQVTTPTTEPYAGAPGSIQFFSNFGSASVSDIFRIIVWGIYDFRSRV